MTFPENLAAALDLADPISDLAEERITELLQTRDKETATEATNLLRSVMQDAALRLQNGGSKLEVSEQLIAASEASFQELMSQNIEIEIDQELAQASSRREILGDPVLMALHHATSLHDGISALRIAGETPSEERETEFKSSLRALRDTLNKYL